MTFCGDVPKRLAQAAQLIAFPATANYFPSILEALSAHKLPVRRIGVPEVNWQSDSTGEALTADLQALRVVKIETISLHMRLIWFAGDDLAR